MKIPSFKGHEGVYLAVGITALTVAMDVVGLKYYGNEVHLPICPPEQQVTAPENTLTPVRPCRKLNTGYFPFIGE